jgi:hypothetical protein
MIKLLDVDEIEVETEQRLLEWGEAWERSFYGNQNSEETNVAEGQETGRDTSGRVRVGRVGRPEPTR